MSNLTTILNLYQSDERVKTLVQHFQSSEKVRLLATGLIGSQESCLLAGAQLNDKRCHLFIATDKEEAAYVQNDLDALLTDETVHFFTDSFKSPQQFDKLDNNNVQQRTELINKTSGQQKAQIIVTYPEALFEKVVSPKVLEASRITITKEEEMDVDTIVSVMVDYGFEKVDFVYEPGQFSIRGGIVDIFSFGNEWPYRIELFDTEVESIRLFDPTTQLSKKNIKSVTIVPNINTEFGEADKVSLLKILPENTVVWIRDVSQLLERLQSSYTKASELADRIAREDNKEKEAELLRERAFILPSEITNDLLDFHLVALRKFGGAIEADAKIIFNTKPQPNFNKNFKFLIENLEYNEEKGIGNYIFTDSTKQIERFYSIFEDLDAKIDFHPVPIALHAGFIDYDLNIACFTDHQIFQRYHRYKLKRGFSKDKALNLKLLRELKSGDYVTHIDHGVGKYSGLEKIEINGHVQESIRVVYKNNDLLYVSINSLHKISKFTGQEGHQPKVSKLGSDAWKTMKQRTKKKMKDIAGELIKLYAKRKAAPGHAFPPDGYLQNELEASFIYEDTPDQLKATIDVKNDMMKEYPMDRLICGDVGFGKTEIAMRAVFKAVVGGKQAAILVPTTILALQHYQTFKSRLKDFGLTVDYINRFRTTKEKTAIFKKLKAGEIDLIIGTHGILSKKIGFKDLGLLVIDEEQKFGVSAKEKLRNIKVNVDTLTLTATPIPRTLQFSLMAARDLSVIRTPPPNRQPIHTEIRIFNDEVIKESIYYEIYRGGQVFFVHNRVKALPDMAALIQRLCPDVSVAVAHGQMESSSLEKTLLEFIDHRYDVLVCTNIIETGLDIANANTIIINNAHQFGMSDLHQLRGRVGRSNKKAFCYLFSPPMSVLTSDARKRLETLEQFSDLGSGFDIAMKDLDIRGAGNLLGGEQSGFISDIGYETYQKILDEAIQELKESHYKDLFKEELEKEDRDYVRDVTIETDIEMHIPDAYVSNTQERLNLYQELDGLNKEEELAIFIKTLEDRFGKIPAEVEELFNGLRLRWVCKKLGFERIILKNNKLRAYFIGNPQSSFFEKPIFNKIIVHVNGKADKRIGFKQSPRYFFMYRESVRTLTGSLKLLKSIADGVLPKKQ